MQRRTNSIRLRGRTTWVRELIHAADVTVFFLDEDQRVTLADIGTRDEIVLWAEELGADVEELELLSVWCFRSSRATESVEAPDPARRDDES